MGIEQALLSKFERGERIPPTETLIILADFYGVSIDYLFGNDRFQKVLILHFYIFSIIHRNAKRAKKCVKVE